jgi:DNA processing protein
MDTKDVLYQIAILNSESVGSVTFRKMYDYFKSSKNIYYSQYNELSKFGKKGKNLYKDIQNGYLLERAKKEVKYCINNNISILSYFDENYPLSLKNCYDAPQILYSLGKPILNNKRMLSVVGTRKCTKYGLDFCNELISEISSYGVTIVSGLAYGIDYQSHLKALEFSIPTLGILGHGLDMIYPQEHRNIAKNILETGALLSEFKSETTILPQNFPKRNRIVAGISDATLVIESPKKGGSLITARLANSYQKDVFALPGNIHSKMSAGCNSLIKSNRAHLIESCNDIVEIMSWQKDESQRIKQAKLDFSKLDYEEKLIAECINKYKNISIDELSIKMNKAINQISPILTMLELDDVIEQLPGNKFCVKN